jgi:Spy/CpxP family protein refolding chaperone
MSNPSKNKTLVSIIVVLLLANVAMLVYFLWLKEPDKPSARTDKNTDRFAEALKKDVGFSEAQVAQYKELKNAKWDKIKSRFDDLRQAKDNFFQLISVENVNDSMLNNAADSIAQRQKSLDLQSFIHLKELRKVCTPEQQPKYDSLVQRVFHRITGSFMRGDSKSPDSTRKN